MISLHITYKKGCYVTEPKYDDRNVVCTNGIHFYLTKEVAFFHNFKIKNDFNGIFKKWYNEGNQKKNMLLTTES